MTDENKKNTEVFEEVVVSGEEEDEVRQLLAGLEKMVVGQDRALRHLERLLRIDKSGIRDKQLPIGALLFAGPSGTGKTYIAEEFARVFIDPGSEVSPLTFVDCTEYVHGHEVANLIGAPPGYIGHGNEPQLGQWSIEKHAVKALARAGYKDAQTLLILKDLATAGAEEAAKARHQFQKLYAELRKKHQMKSVILFDEIEKADARLWNLMLNILSHGELRLMSGETTFFNNSIIFITSNVGGRDIRQIVEEKVLGFQIRKVFDKGQMDAGANEDIYKTVLAEIKKIFPAEFINRICDEIVVFRMFNMEEYRRILDLELERVGTHLRKQGAPLETEYSPAFKEFLLRESDVDKHVGAREIGYVVKKNVREKIALALSLKKISAGDSIKFDFQNDRIVLLRDKTKPPPVTVTAIVPAVAEGEPKNHKRPTVRINEDENGLKKAPENTGSSGDEEDDESGERGGGDESLDFKYEQIREKILKEPSFGETERRLAVKVLNYAFTTLKRLDVLPMSVQYFRRLIKEAAESPGLGDEEKRIVKKIFKFIEKAMLEAGLLRDPTKPQPSPNQAPIKPQHPKDHD